MKNCIFFDGQVIEKQESLRHSLLPWELQGRGVFETMSSKSRSIYFLDKHLERLWRGLKILNIKSPYSQKEIKQGLVQVLKKHKHINGRVRLTVWGEKKTVYSNKINKKTRHLSIVCLPNKPYSQKQYQTGFQVLLFDEKIVGLGAYHRIKSIRYQDFYHAYLLASQQGCQEALLVNRDGELAEGSRTNLFLVVNNKLLTPRLASGCLNGITRQIVLFLAKKKGLPVKTVKIFPEDLDIAQEAFITNSLLGLMPLNRVFSTAFQQKKMGPITRDLFFEYKEYREKNLFSLK